MNMSISGCSSKSVPEALSGTRRLNSETRPPRHARNDLSGKPPLDRGPTALLTTRKMSCYYYGFIGPTWLVDVPYTNYYIPSIWQFIFSPSFYGDWNGAFIDSFKMPLTNQFPWIFRPIIFSSAARTLFLVGSSAKVNFMYV